MRALVYTAPGRVEWQEVADPVLEPHGALVRPLAVARCDLDLPMAAIGLFPAPFAVGHELVAEVVEPGPDSDIETGALVSVPFQVSCGACAACQAGRTVACITYRARLGAAYGFGPGGGDFGGAVSDLVAVPHADHLLLPAPDGISPVALATVPDNSLDAFRCVGPLLADRPGEDVLVCAGAAPSIGLYAVQWAVALGAGSVRYTDDDAERCQAADALGALVERREGPWPRRYDRAGIVVVATDDLEGLVCATRSTADQGHLTIAAVVFGDAPLPLLEMYTRGVTLHVTRADSRRLLPEVLGHVAAGRVDPLAVPTTIVDWDDADQAWLAPATKLVVVRG